MMSRKFVKILCIILAALMILSSVVVLVQVFAADESRIVLSPATGENDLQTIIPIAIGAVAVVAVIVCLVLPKIKKKSSADDDE